jgi:hypothetical protein
VDPKRHAVRIRLTLTASSALCRTTPFVWMARGFVIKLAPSRERNDTSSTLWDLNGAAPLGGSRASAGGSVKTDSTRLFWKRDGSEAIWPGDTDLIVKTRGGGDVGRAKSGQRSPARSAIGTSKPARKTTVTSCYFHHQNSRGRRNIHVSSQWKGEHLCADGLAPRGVKIETRRDLG